MITEEEQKENERAIREYIANGGKITVCEAGARTEDLQVGQWGRPKKKASKKK